MWLLNTLGLFCGRELQDRDPQDQVRRSAALFTIVLNTASADLALELYEIRERSFGVEDNDRLVRETLQRSSIALRTIVSQ
jgi:hypothetical protein